MGRERERERRERRDSTATVEKRWNSLCARRNKFPQIRLNRKKINLGLVRSFSHFFKNFSNCLLQEKQQEHSHKTPMPCTADSKRKVIAPGSSSMAQRGNGWGRGRERKSTFAFQCCPRYMLVRTATEEGEFEVSEKETLNNSR